MLRKHQVLNEIYSSIVRMGTPEYIVGRCDNLTHPDKISCSLIIIGDLSEIEDEVRIALERIYKLIQVRDQGKTSQYFLQTRHYKDDEYFIELIPSGR